MSEFVNESAGEMIHDGYAMVATDTREVALRDLENLSGDSSKIVSTFTDTDFKTNLQIVKAVSNAEQLQDHLNENINLANWIAQVVDYSVTLDDGSNEVRTGVRCVIVDDKGVAYACLSDGVNKALTNIASVLGLPATWPKGSIVPVKAKLVKGRNGFSYMTLQLV